MNTTERFCELYVLLGESYRLSLYLSPPDALREKAANFRLMCEKGVVFGKLYSFFIKEAEFLEEIALIMDGRT